MNDVKMKFEFQNYQKMFQLSGSVPFLYSEFFVLGFLDIDCMVLNTKDLWKSYFPKIKLNQTLQAGLEIYSNKDNYQFIQESLEQSFLKVKEIVSMGDINVEVFDVFVNEIINFRKNYGYTEFFYTDLAFEKQNEIPQIKESFKTFGDFKLKGRKKMVELFFIQNSVCFQFFSKIAHEFNLEIEDILDSSISEIKGLFAGRDLNYENIRIRRESYLIHVKNNEIVEEGKFVSQDVIKNFHVDSIQTELKGKTASVGYAVGRAKVLKVSLKEYGSIKDLVDSVEEGDILIVETTEPDLIPVCKKVSAIVTNQGGMMSHAAIVSRELKIPCIVATGNATEVFQDGDMVEVDTGGEIVRKLVKSETLK